MRNEKKLQKYLENRLSYLYLCNIKMISQNLLLLTKTIILWKTKILSTQVGKSMVL